MRDKEGLRTGLSFLLILLVLLVLGIFSQTFTNTRLSIEAEGRTALEFRAAWFELKADLLELSLGLGGRSRREEAGIELARTEALFQRLENSRVLSALGAVEALGPGPAARTLSSAPTAGASPAGLPQPGLASQWDSLAGLARSALGSDQARTLDYYRALSLESKRFEADIEGRLGLIDRSAVSVMASMTVVNRFIIMAMLALLGLGLWSASLRMRERADRRRLRDLMTATLDGQEAERKRLALELHDTVAQDLAAASMYVSRLPDDPEGHRTAITSRIQGAIRQLRDLSWQMRPPALERYGFLEAAAQLCRDLGNTAGLAIDFLPPPGGLSGLGEAEALSLYRILQEALANVARHAGARKARVQLEVSEGSLRMRIEDDGQGFDPDDPRPGPGHQGIPGMKERALMLGGSLEVESSPGAKTIVLLELPYARA